MHNIDDTLMKPLQFLLLDHKLNGYAADGELARGRDRGIALKSWNTMEA